METKKRSVSKDKSKKKSKSSEKKVKTEDIVMESGPSSKMDLGDIKNRASIKAHKIDNVSESL